MPLALTSISFAFLATWKRTNKRFFRKYREDKRTMEIVAVLAELIATNEAQAWKPTPFYC